MTKKVFEYTVRIKVTDETALRDFTVKTATERKELDRFNENNQRAREEAEADGESWTTHDPTMQDLMYLLDITPVFDGPEVTGVEWLSSIMSEVQEDDD